MIKFHYFMFFINMILMLYNAANHNYLAFLNACVMLIAWGEVELYYVIKKMKDKDNE